MPFVFRFFLIFGFVFSNSTHAIKLNRSEIKPKNLYSVTSAVSKLKQRDIVKLLRDFVRCCEPNRFPGTPGHKLAAPYLVNQIRKIDPNTNNIIYIDEFTPDVDHAIKLYEDDFKREVESNYKKTNPIYVRWRRFTDSIVKEIKSRKHVPGKNVIWERKGNLNPDEIIVIGAHYDTTANDKKTLMLKPDEKQPGADDNGSGVAVALGLIQILSKMELPKTVRVVFYDWEELGFLGSRAFVKKYEKELKEKKFAGNINLEMLGHDSKSQDKTKRNGNMKLYIRRPGESGHASDKRFANRLIKAGKKVTSTVKFKLVANGFNSSDHISFWDAGFPAVAFTQDWENDFNTNRYHGRNDFVETLNFKTLYHSYKYITGAVAAWAFDLL